MPPKINHVALIMDGNNRWSKKNNKTLYYAYDKGALKLLELADYLLNKKDINIVSAFALSTNNLNRSKKNLDIIKKVISHVINKIDYNQLTNFKVKFIGQTNIFGKKIEKKITDVEKLNFEKKKTLNIFINYGGQEEIINMIYFFKNFTKKIDKETINQEYFNNLYSSPDILIRSGGYSRLSNFILYQLSFTELFFIKKLWPDLNKTDLLRIINKYYKIDRKFGL